LSRERVDIGLPPAGKLAIAGGGLLLVAVVALLVAQLTILADSREHIVAQDRKVNRLLKGVDPALDELEPAAEDARQLARDARPLLRDARPLAREGTAFVRELRTTMVPLLRELEGARLGAAVEVTANLARSLSEGGRLVTLVDLGTDLIEGLRDSEFIPRTLRAADAVPEMRLILAETLGVQRATLRTQRRTLGVQRQTRDIQVQTLDIQKRLLAIQEEALVHIRSIDRKTGGTVPAPTAAPPR
jgi:ABC-type transporter Mla subunit MlaD